MDRPRLRPVEAFPVDVKGETMIALRDPEDLADDTILLSEAAFVLVRLFDGERTVADIQAAIAKAGGGEIPDEAIRRIIDQLDEHRFLDSPSYETHLRELRAAFAARPDRPAAHAGAAYPADPEALRTMLDGFFTAPGGPGEAATSPPGGAGAAVRGLVAPHIDFQRGGPCYAWAYRRLAAAPPPRRFVVFGTCHTPMRRLFALTRKPYATPFGAARADPALVDALGRLAGGRYFEDEFSHRHEHSIEFQVVFLQRLFGPDVTVVPVLCGSLEWFLAKGRLPSETQEMQDFAGFARAALSEGPPTCLVAGADLSHVGPRFGDRTRCTPAFLDRVRRHDLECLARVEAGDAAGFFKTIAEVGDRHRVCGLAPIYAVLSLLDGVKGKVLKYDQAVDPDGSQCVSFASLSFPGT